MASSGGIVMKGTDLGRLCEAIETRQGDDDSPDWKTGAEMRDNLTNRMNTYGLVMALLIGLTWSQSAPSASSSSVWSTTDVATVTSWYFFLLYVSTVMFAIGIMTVVEILDRTAVTPVFLMSDFMKKMGAHSRLKLTVHTTRPLLCTLRRAPSTSASTLLPLRSALRPQARSISTFRICS